MELIWRHCLWFLFLASGSLALSFSHDLRPSWPSFRTPRSVLLMSAFALCGMPKTAVANDRFLELPLQVSSPEPEQQRRKRGPPPPDIRGRTTWEDFLTMFFETGPEDGDLQKFSALIDTGSSTTWVPHKSICTLERCPWGSYDQDGVPTFRHLSSPSDFNATYSNAPSGAGPWISDEVQLDISSIPNFPLGLSYSELQPESGQKRLIPMLGIGPRPSTFESPPQHPNFPEVLKERGVIKTVAYSIWKSPTRAKRDGSILFGAIDTSKFSGRLLIVDSLLGDLIVRIHSIRAPSTRHPLNYGGILVLLDSGSSTTLLPRDVFDELVKNYEAEWSPVMGHFLVPCPGPEPSGVIFAFQFGKNEDFTLNVDRDHFIREHRPGLCYLRLKVGNDKNYILGTAFFNAAYLVFDLTNKKVGIGQAVDTSADRNVISFEDAGAPIPSLGIEVCFEENFHGHCVKYTGKEGFPLELHQDHKDNVRSARAISPHSHCIICKTVRKVEGKLSCEDRDEKKIHFSGEKDLHASGPAFDPGNWLGIGEIQGFVCRPWD